MKSRAEKNNERFIEAIGLLRRSPVRAIFQAVSSIEVERDADLQGIYLRTLVQELCAEGLFLELAAAVGEMLVREDPDQSHYLLLADVYDALGKARMARGARAQGKRHPNRHDDPVIADLARRRLAARARSRGPDSD